MHAYIPAELAEVISSYCFTGLSVAAVYDHALTLDSEVQTIWKRPLTLLSALFWLNRYLAPLQYIAYVVGRQATNWDDVHCQRYARIPGALYMVSLSVIQIFLVLHSAALFWRRAWVVLFGLFTLLSLEIGVMAAALVAGTASAGPNAGCIVLSSTSTTAAFWISPLVLYSLLFVLITSKAWSERHMASSNAKYGFVYTGFLLLLTAADAVLFLYSPTRVLGASSSSVMSSALTSRLALDLLTSTASPSDCSVEHASSWTERLSRVLQLFGGQPIPPSNSLPVFRHCGFRRKGHSDNTPEVPLKVLPIQPVFMPIPPDQVKRSRRSMMLERTIIVSPPIRD